MSCRLLSVTLDVSDPAPAAQFWAALIGREIIADARGLLLPGSETQAGLRFAPSESARLGPDPIHLHLLTEPGHDQQETVAVALRLGARPLDVGQLPDEPHVVLADPAGNPFCVIEPGNAFLAGCGPLAELACDGGRAVGLFWAAALEWPLVWDRDEETAVQSPAGGTKVAWGGPPDAPKRGRSRQRLDLRANGDLAAEVDRLVGLGAAVLGSTGGGVELADPGGNEFFLTA
ncbi:VOC family protein [Microlunatus ginsengisoli]|uniref:VOC family protein n=1 Tax=Microlunatus ginsengisoli TaxID=363863 RepID=A0ABP7ADS5_9ACTN